MLEKINLMQSHYQNDEDHMGAIAEEEDEVDDQQEVVQEQNTNERKKKTDAKIAAAAVLCDEKDPSVVTTKEGARNHIESVVIKSVLRAYTIKVLHAHWARTLIEEFILTLVLRKRFQRKMKAIPKLQRFLRMCLAKMHVRKLKRTVGENKRLQRIERWTRLNPDQTKLNACAQLIQEHLFNRIKRKQEAKELRVKLKELPQVCRSSFVKMHYLKAQTATLTTTVNRKLRKQ